MPFVFAYIPGVDIRVVALYYARRMALTAIAHSGDNLEAL